MEETYGCNLINTKRDGREVTEFVGRYHVHILVRQGQMTFSDGKNSFTSRQGDLAIWQMSNTIQRVECSDDFEADVLLLSGQFLQQYNPEMVWASKGFVFIRINPSFHLDDESQKIMDDDFALFRNRLLMEDAGFKREILGRVMQIFIYDLWTICQHGLSQMDTSDNSARIFLRFLAMAQQNARTEREVNYYADLLCITPKYLSQVSRTVTGLPASQWIQFYASFELVSLLNDTTKTLTEISDQMHFENVSHFSRYVKKTLGKSPSQYRQK